VPGGESSPPGIADGRAVSSADRFKLRSGGSRALLSALIPSPLYPSHHENDGLPPATRTRCGCSVRSPVAARHTAHEQRPGVARHALRMSQQTCPIASWTKAKVSDDYARTIPLASNRTILLSHRQSRSCLQREIILNVCLWGHPATAHTGDRQPPHACGSGYVRACIWYFSAHLI